MKRPKPLKRRIVEVGWIDATTHDPWMKLKQAKKEGSISIHARSVGFIVMETAKVLVLASSVDLQDVKGEPDGTNAVFGQVCIPKVQIVSRRWVK